MNVQTGRFVNEDSFEGTPDDPSSVHKYIYAKNNPSNFIDPSGNISAVDLVETELAGLSIEAMPATQGAALLDSVIANGVSTGDAALLDTILEGAAGEGASSAAAAASSLPSLWQVLGSVAVFGAALTQTGDGPSNEDQAEYFFRAMSAVEYSGLVANRGLSIRAKTGRSTPESFVTQNPQYVFQLAARFPDLYQVLVVFKMQVGTKAALSTRGATSNDAEFLDPSLVGLRNISQIPAEQRGDVVHIKGERNSVTYGLRQGTVGIFNSRIVSYQAYKL